MRQCTIMVRVAHPSVEKKKHNEPHNGADGRAFHTKQSNPGTYGCLRQQLKHQHRTTFYARSSDRPDSKTNTNVYTLVVPPKW